MHTNIKKTKIVATIGPASESPEIIEKMIKEGANVFRFNMKHNSLEWHEKTIKKAADAAETLDMSIGILLDLPSLAKDYLDNLHATTKKRIDFVALSYTRKKKDLDELKKILKKQGIKAKIVAKIESQASIDNIDEIAKFADAVMIARGDLGVETPIERLAFYQKTIINVCRRESVPVIVATHMLESMVNNPMPTRAEATDVANAVLDGADALMLSEETAIGRHPAKVVEEMNKIAVFNENRVFESVLFEEDVDNPTELIVGAAQSVALGSENIKIDRIVVLTETGYTAKVMSGFRPKIPIIAITDNSETVKALTLSYGVVSHKISLPDNQIFSPTKLTAQLKQKKIVEKGEIILVVHGQHWKREGQTNALALISVN